MFSVNHRDLTVITNGGQSHRSYQLSHSNSAASSGSSGSCSGSSSEGSMNSLPPPSPPRSVSLIHHNNHHVGCNGGISNSSGRSLIHCNHHHHASQHHQQLGNCMIPNGEDIHVTSCTTTAGLRNDSQQSLYSVAGSSSQSSVNNKSLYEHEYQNLNESLMLENRRLKSDVEMWKRRCSQYERVESEIVKVCQAHEDLMASSEKKEQLEKSVRLKLEAEIQRLNQENRDLRNRTGTTSSLAEYELQAQRATLEEQRFHIQILDGALIQAQANIHRLESELMQAKVAAASVNHLPPHHLPASPHHSPVQSVTAPLSPSLPVMLQPSSPPPPPAPAPSVISVSTTAVL